MFVLFQFVLLKCDFNFFRSLLELRDHHLEEVLSFICHISSLKRVLINLCKIMPGLDLLNLFLLSFCLRGFFSKLRSIQILSLCIKFVCVFKSKTPRE